MTAPLVVVGDALLDRDLDGRVERFCPDAPTAPVVDGPIEEARPGGAGLAAVLAARDGRAVTLVTALAGDPAGRELAELLGAAGVEAVDLGLDGPTPEKVRVRAHGRTLVRVDRGLPGAGVGRVTAPARSAIAGARAVLVSDYGRGVASQRGVRDALRALPASAPLVWDPHPRGPRPVPGVLVATPNRSEADAGRGLADVAVRARDLARRWKAVNVCVTLGPGGALLAGGDGPPLVAPAPPVAGGDPCGAGDRFASALAGALADGVLPSVATAAAVERAAAFVAAGGSAAALGRHSGERRGREEPDAGAAVVAADARARGETVVAAGGCFDLLHAGHVATLQAARALGDRLIVLLNSDASVARLKGPDRPLVAEADRAAVLRGLACVDAVEVFDDDTPAAALDRLRPDLFVKGGDYRLGELPEAAVLERWGGQAVVLPYVPGHSTTRLIEEAARGQ